MSFSAPAPCQGARRLGWLASTALTSIVLPLCAVPAVAQQTASPDIELREVKVNEPAPPRRTVSRPSTPAPRTTTAPPTAANDPVVVSPTAVATPAANVASSVTVINSQQLEQQQPRSAASFPSLPRKAKVRPGPPTQWKAAPLTRSTSAAASADRTPTTTTPSTSIISTPALYR